MGSVNLGDTQQAEDTSKATSNNRAGVPLCFCCDNRASIQTNLHGPFYPTLLRSRICQEMSSDLIFRQPCFFYPHFTQPCVHDNSVLQNYCCAHDCIKNQSSKPNIKDKVVHGCGHIRRQVTPQAFARGMERNTECDKNGAENEQHNLSQWSNHTREPEWNNQSCKCGESLPWTSSPLILPVVSYCVMWNKNDNCFDYSCKQMVNVNQKNLGNVIANTESKTKCDKYMELDTGNCSEGNDSKKEIERHSNQCCTPSVSLNSSILDEGSMYITQKSGNSSTKADPDVHSEEEAAKGLQVRSSNLSNNAQKYFSTKSVEKVFPSDDDYCVTFSAENQSEFSCTAESKYDLKAQDPSAKNEEVNDEVKSVIFEENKIPISSKTLPESFEEKDIQKVNVIEVEQCNIKSAATAKKFIKNFTMTSRTEETISDKSQISAAGGDLGGNACISFQMRIQSENIREDTESHNSQLKTISSTGMEEKKFSKSSGIARLIHPNISRHTKNIKKDSNDLDFINMKRKRCQIDSQVRGDTFKILKVTAHKKKIKKIEAAQKTRGRQELPKADFQK